MGTWSYIIGFIPGSPSQAFAIGTDQLIDIRVATSTARPREYRYLAHARILLIGREGCFPLRYRKVTGSFLTG